MSFDPPFEPDRFVCDRIVTQDVKTGREVWQVTSGEGESVSPYMDCVAWSSDDRFLVVNCNRTGSWQPYRLQFRYLRKVSSLRRAGQRPSTARRLSQRT